MKRDMDLVREILFKMENQDKYYEHSEGSLKIDSYSREQVSYHMKIMAQAGLLNADMIEAPMPAAENWVMPKSEIPYYSISWDGHEFLAASKNETFWKSAKADIAKVIGETGRFMLPVLTQLLTSYIKAELKLP